MPLIQTVIFKPKQAHYHLKWLLHPLEKKTANTLFQVFPIVSTIIQTVYHLFDLHWFDLGLICFYSVYVRTGDMWHRHLLMWTTIALTTTGGGKGGVQQLGFMHFSLSFDASNAHVDCSAAMISWQMCNLMVKDQDRFSLENINCLRLCETSLAMLLIAMELNMDDSRVWCTLQIHLLA